jgi:hypothetical protein
MGRIKNSRERKRGRSYSLRVAAVNRIYDRYRTEGLSNREIWYRHVYPVYGICERTFYNLLKASARDDVADRIEESPTLFDGMEDE